MQAGYLWICNNMVIIKCTDRVSEAMPRKVSKQREMPQSGVYATPHKGLINNKNNKHATVGRLSDTS